MLILTIEHELLKNQNPAYNSTDFVDAICIMSTEII